MTWRREFPIQIDTIESMFPTKIDSILAECFPERQESSNEAIDMDVPWRLTRSKRIEFSRSSPTTTWNQDLQFTILLLQFHDARIERLNDNEGDERHSSRLVSVCSPVLLERHSNHWESELEESDHWSRQRRRRYEYTDQQGYLREKVAPPWPISGHPNSWNNTRDDTQLNGTEHTETQILAIKWNVPETVKWTNNVRRWR